MRSDQEIKRYPKLRKDLRISKQVRQERVGYIVKDPIKTAYFRFDEEEWEIIQLFDGSSTLEEMVANYNKNHKNDEIDLETIQDFYSNLDSMNLLEKPKSDLNYMLVEKMKEMRRSQLLSKKGSLMYKRFPLMDPDRLFNKIIPYLRFVWTKAFFVFSMATMLVAIIIIGYNWDKFNAGIFELFSFSEISTLHLITLWFVIYITIFIHELGHGLTCKYYGGEVHEIGFLLLFFQPCLYCNVNDAWLFDKKWKQVLVTLAGGYIEFFIGSIFTIIWALTNPNTFINVLSFQVMTICSISTVFFNFNPLIKLDGYYLLADYLEIPNLRDNSFSYVKYLVSKKLFRMNEEPPLETTPRERKIYTAYGVAGFFWLLSLFTGLFFLAKNFLTEHFQEVGLIISFFIAYKLFGQQLKKGGIFLFQWFLSKKPYFQEKFQNKKVRTGAGIGAGVTLLLLFFPLSYSVPGKCSLEPSFTHIVRADSPGKVTKFLIHDGEKVNPGEVVVEMENFTLPYDRDIAMYEMKKANFKLRKAMTEDQSKVSGLQRELKAKSLNYKKKKNEVEALQVSYPIHYNFPGILSCTDEIQKLNAFVSKGDEICKVLGVHQLRTVIQVSEQEVRFIKEGDAVEFKLGSDPFQSYDGKVNKIRVLSTSDPHNPKSRLYNVEILIDNSGQLKPGMTGIAKIKASPVSTVSYVFRKLAMFFRMDLFF